jgi:hypothetical protein
LSCVVTDAFSRYKTAQIAVQNGWVCGTKALPFQLLAISKRLFAYKQKTFHLQAKDRTLVSKRACAYKQIPPKNQSYYVSV